MGERPIVILASGPRCGSTWLQRALSTHPDVFIWGEHGGQLAPILGAADDFAAWSNNQAARAADEFRTAGTSGFMANLAPSESVVREQIAGLIRGLFHRLPDGAPPPVGLRWGFKEVRYGADVVRQLVRYLPDITVVCLTRDPVSVLRSLGWWERTSAGFWGRDRTVAALASWRDINASFLDAADLSHLLLPVRYEDLTANRPETMRTICDFLGLDDSKLDHAMFDDVVHAPAPWGRQVRRLAPRAEVIETYRDVLADQELDRIAHRLGYSLSADSGTPTSTASTHT